MTTIQRLRSLQQALEPVEQYTVSLQWQETLPSGGVQRMAVTGRLSNAVTYVQALQHDLRVRNLAVKILAVRLEFGPTGLSF